MTEPMTLQQQLAEMREENCILRIQTGFVCEDTKYCCKSCRPYYTLQAILDIPERPYDEKGNLRAKAWDGGYNSALAAVAEVAREGMRG